MNNPSINPDSEDELDQDPIPDYSAVLGRRPIRPTGAAVIPRRGEKAFEPSESLPLSHGMALAAAREAMYTALAVPRVLSSKAVSYAVWNERARRATLLMTRGNHLTKMGHAVRRSVSPSSSSSTTESQTQIRIDLLPEEVLYLIDRGSLQLFIPANPDSYPAFPEPITSPAAIPDNLIPVSVEEAWAHIRLIRKDYAVYAHLRRAGWSVLPGVAPLSMRSGNDNWTSGGHLLAAGHRQIPSQREGIWSRLMRRVAIWIHSRAYWFIPSFLMHFTKTLCRSHREFLHRHKPDAEEDQIRC